MTDYPILEQHWGDLDSAQRHLYKLAAMDMPVSHDALVEEAMRLPLPPSNWMALESQLRDELLHAEGWATDLEADLHDQEGDLRSLEADLHKAHAEIRELKARLEEDE